MKSLNLKMRSLLPITVLACLPFVLFSRLQSSELEIGTSVHSNRADSLTDSSMSIDIYKIWDKGNHNAFTDLTRFCGYFYCTFREGTGHVNGNGTIRIIRSSDGVSWKSVAELKEEGVDLRDPKISIHPDGKLMIVMGGSIYKDRKIQGRTSRVSFSNVSGDRFTDPIPVQVDESIRSNNDWLWRITWNGRTGYGVVYQPPLNSNRPWGLQLVSTKDGIKYNLVKTLDVPGNPNEVTVRFDRCNRLHMIVRREGANTNGMIGQAEYPYQDFQWHEMNYRLGGPNMIQIPDGRWVVGTRTYQQFRKGKKGSSTSILIMNENADFHPLVELPSGGDTSYPGMLIYHDKLWFVYYSSHEGKTSIYMAVVPMRLFRDVYPAHLYPKKS